MRTVLSCNPANDFSGSKCDYPGGSEWNQLAKTEEGTQGDMGEAPGAVLAPKSSETHAKSLFTGAHHPSENLENTPSSRDWITAK